MLNKLPSRVTLLLWLVLFFTAWNLLRIWTALEWQGTLKEYNVQPQTWVIVFSGIVWSLTGFAIIWSLWQGKAWTKQMLFAATAGYTVWYWAERLIWQMPRPNWPFAVILNLILISFIIFTSKSTT